MSTCTNHFPTTEVLYAELDGKTSLQVLTGICCFLVACTVVIYLEEVWFIVHHYPHKTLRNKIICQLGLFPVIGFTSCLAVLVPRSTLLCELIASSYLSVCLLLFVNMLISYFRGSKGLLEIMSAEKMQYRTPPCCCCCFCLNNLPFNRKYLKIAMIMVVQIVILKPLTLFIVAVLWADGRYTPGDETNSRNAVFFTNLLSILSTLVGIWGMSITFRSTRGRLPNFRVTMKFVSLQIVLVFVNLQFGVISLLARNNIPKCEDTRDSRVMGYAIHHMLLMLESFLAAVLARFAYRRLDPELINQLEKEITVNVENERVTALSVTADK